MKEMFLQLGECAIFAILFLIICGSFENVLSRVL